MLAGTGPHARCVPSPSGSTVQRRRRRTSARRLDSVLRPSTTSSSSNSGHRGGGAMLSRIAESLFWIGRYVERAEDTARILDVQTQLILEDPGVDEETTCRTLLSIMGVDDSTRTTPADRHRARCCGCWPTTSARTASIAATLGGRPGERPPGPRDPVDLDVGGAEHDVPRDPLGPLPLDAAAGGLPLGARPGRADQRDRRGDDDAATRATSSWCSAARIERADMTSRLVATACR